MRFTGPANVNTVASAGKQVLPFELLEDVVELASPPVSVVLSFEDVGIAVEFDVPDELSELPVVPVKGATLSEVLPFALLEEIVELASPPILVMLSFEVVGIAVEFDVLDELSELVVAPVMGAKLSVDGDSLVGMPSALRFWPSWPCGSDELTMEVVGALVELEADPGTDGPGAAASGL
jgi:hypothetical protein